MTADNTRHLHEFLKLTDAERLGESDLIAGANTLAAMAILLANIQRPGSGLETRFGDSITVGTSVIVSGSLSASLVGERVLTGLGEFQNNLINRQVGIRSLLPNPNPMPFPNGWPSGFGKFPGLS